MRGERQRVDQRLEIVGRAAAVDSPQAQRASAGRIEPGHRDAARGEPAAPMLAPMRPSPTIPICKDHARGSSMQSPCSLIEARRRGATSCGALAAALDAGRPATMRRR